jgi:hypothetical protein
MLTTMIDIGSIAAIDHVFSIIFRRIFNLVDHLLVLEARSESSLVVVSTMMLVIHRIIASTIYSVNDSSTPPHAHGPAREAQTGGAGVEIRTSLLTD